MKSEDYLDAVLKAAKTSPTPLPSQDLISRVLADATDALPMPEPTITAKKPSFLSRLFGPIGGFGGAFALGTCAAFGVVVGVGYADTIYSIPGLETVFSGFGESIDATSPYETLALMMSES